MEMRYQCHDCGDTLEGDVSPGGTAHIISPCSRCMDLANDLGLRGKGLDCKDANKR